MELGFEGMHHRFSICKGMYRRLAILNGCLEDLRMEGIVSKIEKFEGMY